MVLNTIMNLAIVMGKSLPEEAMEVLDPKLVVARHKGVVVVEALLIQLVW